MSTVKTIRTTIEDLGTSLASLAVGAQQEIAKLRDGIEDARRQLQALEGNHVPVDQLVERFCAWVDLLAHTYADGKSQGQGDLQRYARKDLLPLLSWNEVRDPFPNGLGTDALCFLLGDLLKAVGRDRIPMIGGVVPGIRSTERPAAIEAAKAELAKLEAAEEEGIQAAARAGVRIARSPAVVARLHEEARTRERDIHTLIGWIERDERAASQGQASEEAIKRLTGPPQAREVLAQKIEEDIATVTLAAEDLRINPTSRREDYRRALARMELAVRERW